jgi:hypothetical protein
MIQLYLFLINVCDTCLIFIGGKVVLIGWKRSLESWVCLIWKLMYWYTVHTIRAFVTQVFTRLFLWNIINNIIVLLSYWIRVSLSSWCYCHHGVIVIMVLLSSWCYCHHGVIVIMVLLSSWCYCHHGVIVIMVLLSSWCYCHLDVIVIMVLLSSWCYCHHGVIVILMLLSSWCYWHPGVLVWISTVLVTKTVNVNWFLLKHCIWWLQVTSPI